MVNLSLCDVSERAKPLSYLIVSIDSIRFIYVYLTGFSPSKLSSLTSYYFAFQLLSYGKYFFTFIFGEKWMTNGLYMLIRLDLSHRQVECLHDVILDI